MRNVVGFADVQGLNVCAKALGSVGYARVVAYSSLWELLNVLHILHHTHSFLQNLRVNITLIGSRLLFTGLAFSLCHVYSLCCVYALPISALPAKFNVSIHC